MHAYAIHNCAGYTRQIAQLWSVTFGHCKPHATIPSEIPKMYSSSSATSDAQLKHTGSEWPPHRCRTIVKEWTDQDGGIFVTCRTDRGTLQTHHIIAMSSLSRRACYKCKHDPILQWNCDGAFAVVSGEYLRKLQLYPQFAKFCNRR